MQLAILLHVAPPALHAMLVLLVPRLVDPAEHRAVATFLLGRLQHESQLHDGAAHADTTGRPRQVRYSEGGGELRIATAGWGGSRGHYATPADFPPRGVTSCRGLRVRRCGLGCVHRSRFHSLSPRAKP